MTEDKDISENGLTEFKPRVTPKATRWLWGIFLFMSVVFMISACLKSNQPKPFFYDDTNQYNQVNTMIAFGDLLGAKRVVERSSPNTLLSLYVDSQIAYKDGKYSKALSLLKKIEAEDPKLLMAEKLDGYLTFKSIVASAVEAQDGI